MKTCLRCQLEKPLEDFNRYARSKDGYKSYCRQCTADYYRGNVVKHKENVARRRRRLQEEIRDVVYRYLLENPCVDCGETDPVVLEFDHIDRSQKLESVSRLRSSNPNLAKVLEEIEKCEVRCCNCHRRRTAIQMGWSIGPRIGPVS